MSLPTRERGLKHFPEQAAMIGGVSLPTWARGLKHYGFASDARLVALLLVGGETICCIRCCCLRRVTLCRGANSC